MAAASGGMYLLGKMTSNDHARETGLLAGEAALDSLVPTYALKYATRRERPHRATATGAFGVAEIHFLRNMLRQHGRLRAYSLTNIPDS